MSWIGWRALVGVGLAVVALAGCGNGGGGSVSSGESIGETVELPGDAPKVLKPRMVPASDAVAGIGSLGAGSALLGTPSGPLRLDPPPAGALGIEVEATAGDPRETGAIRAFAPRWEGTQFVAADKGLFYYADDLLLYSPLSAGLDGAPTGAAAGDVGDVIVATATNLYWDLGGKLYRITVPGRSGGPAFLARGSDAKHDVTFAAWGDGLLALELSDMDLRATDLKALGLGKVAGLAAAPDGTLAVATSAGVAVRSTAGRWTRYTLSSDRSTEIPAAAVAATSASDGSPVLYAVFASGLWRLAAGQQTVFGVAELAAGPAISLGADRAGRVFMGRKTDILQVLTADLPEGKVTFADNIVPFIDTYCLSCHGARGYAPIRLWKYEDFKMYIDRIVPALDSGKMPLGRRLAPPDYEVVKRWKQDGMLP